jgi:hypothetical protein
MLLTHCLTKRWFRWYSPRYVEADGQARGMRSLGPSRSHSNSDPSPESSVERLETFTVRLRRIDVRIHMARFALAGEYQPSFETQPPI